MFTLLEPSIKFIVIVQHMVLTLAFVNVKSKNYFLSRRIVCVVEQSALLHDPARMFDFLL